MLMMMIGMRNRLTPTCGAHLPGLNGRHPSRQVPKVLSPPYYSNLSSSPVRSPIRARTSATFEEPAGCWEGTFHVRTYVVRDSSSPPPVRRGGGIPRPAMVAQAPVLGHVGKGAHLDATAVNIAAPLVLRPKVFPFTMSGGSLFKSASVRQHRNPAGASGGGGLTVPSSSSSQLDTSPQRLRRVFTTHACRRRRKEELAAQHPAGSGSGSAPWRMSSLMKKPLGIAHSVPLGCTLHFNRSAMSHESS